MIAAKQGELAIVKILLEGGAAADIESKVCCVL